MDLDAAWASRVWLAYLDLAVTIHLATWGLK